MAAFVADTFAGLSTGATTGGTTTSDTLGLWTANTGNFVKATAGGVYPTNSGSRSYASIQNVQASNCNLDLTWTLTPGSGGDAVTPSGYQIGAFVHFTYTQGKSGILVTYEPGGSGWYLREVSDYPPLTYFAQGVSFVGVPSTVTAVLSIRAATATLTLTGGVSSSTSITLKQLAATVGYVGIYGLNTASNGITDTLGPKIGAFSATSYTGSPTKVVVSVPYDIVTAAAVTGSSLVPSAINQTKLQSLGYADAGFTFNRQIQVTLDGPAASTITLTPTMAGTLSTGSTIVIPSGDSGARAIYTPAAGVLSSPLTLSFTNNGSIGTTTTASMVVKNKLAMFIGDSRMDRSRPTYCGIWPTMDSGNSAWNNVSEAIEFSQFIYGGDTSYRISTRYATTSIWPDSTRTQQAWIIWGGRNDLNAGNSAATTFAGLQTVVNGLKAAGCTNIAVCTEISSNASNVATYFAAVQAFNVLINAAYGASGSDTSVAVIDLYGAATAFGTQTGYTNTSYYAGDGIHPTGATGVSTIVTAFTNYLSSLPANQGISAGVLTNTGTGTGSASFSCTPAFNPNGAATYQLVYAPTSGGTAVNISGQSGNNPASGTISTSHTSLQAATRWYRMKFTDTSTSTIAYSNEVTVPITSGVSGGGGTAVPFIGVNPLIRGLC